MYSPIWLVVSDTMPNRTKNAKKNKGKMPANLPMQHPKKEKKTPFGDTGSILGNSIGGMFGNASMGRGVGRWLGTGIGSIFGSGDYQLTGLQPKYNVLTNGNQIPKFETTRATNVVCHREYLGDINGTTAFNNTTYPLNPGMSQTFPWLSGIASNYQEYKFHGLVFEFRPLITDFVTSGAPGVVVMATSYNADVTAYATKQQMENSEFAVSVKPTMTMMHGVECAPSQTINPTKYIRTGTVPIGQDLRLYDQGIFQFATQANPVQDLGELWVSYCVEFLKPILPVDVSGGTIDSGHSVRASATNTGPLGTIQLNNIGSLLQFTCSSTTAQWLAQPNTAYLVDVYWTNTTSVTWVPPGTSFIGCTPQSVYSLNTQSVAFSPPSGTTSTTASMQWIVKSANLNSQLISITFNALGTVPAGNVDVIITQLDINSY
jgi:outer membrane lipoprotein SlyB